MSSTSIEMTKPDRGQLMLIQVCGRVKRDLEIDLKRSKRDLTRAETTIQRPLDTKGQVESTQDMTDAMAQAAIACKLSPMLVLRMAEVFRV